MGFNNRQQQGREKSIVCLMLLSELELWFFDVSLEKVIYNIFGGFFLVIVFSMAVWMPYFANL